MNHARTCIAVAVATVLACPLALAGGNNKGGKTAAQIDTDNNGMISQAEYVAYAKNKFDRLDANNDNRLTSAEFQGDLRATAQAGKGAQAGARGQAGAQAGTQAGAQTRAQGAAGGGETMARFDANADGSVSADEHAAAARENFAQLDRDRDGSLSRNERQNDPMAMGEDMERTTASVEADVEGDQ